MSGERHYKVAKSLIADGTIKTITDLFAYFPKTSVAKDLKVHYHTLLDRINNPGGFTLDQLFDLANLCEVDPMIIIHMAAKGRLKNTKHRKGSK